jgi:hypothetical protein
MEFLGYVFPRAVLGGIPVLGLLLWCRNSLDVRGFAALAAAGAAALLLFTVTWVFFVYRNDRYVDLRARLPRVRVWRRA